MGGGGGCARVQVLCTFFICAYLSALLSLISVLIFLRKFLVLRVVGGWLWCYHFVAGVHCFADIDQADLLGGGGELLG